MFKPAVNKEEILNKLIIINNSKKSNIIFRKDFFHLKKNLKEKNYINVKTESYFKNNIKIIISSYQKNIEILKKKRI